MKKKLWAFCVCLYSICCLPLASNAQTLPTNIQGLMAWFSADSLKLPADASVDVWNNNNPNYSCTLSQSDTRFCPKFIENALNAKPLVRFNGSNNYLNGGNTLNMGSEGQSIFIVAKSNANTGTLLAKSANGTSQYSQNKYALRCTTNNRIFFEYIDDKTYLITPEETLSNYSLFTSTVDLKEGIIAFFVNSKKVSENFTQQNHVFNSTFDFLVGAYNNANGSIPPTAYLNGDIAEIIIYNRAVTQQERQAIENYLRLKYFPGTERLPFSLGEDTYQPYSLQNLALEVPDKPYFTSITWNTGETTRSVTAEKPGIYSVQVVDDWGYEYYDTIVFAKPDIHQLRDTILCIGDTLTWDCGIAGDYSYSWNTGANTQSIEIYEPGDYWVEITDTLHNTARSTMIHVTVDNFSAEASLGNDAELCAGNYIELVSGDTTSIVSYLWNTGVTSSRLQVSETGTYWLKATNANNCIAHDTISVEINGIAPFANFIASNECVNQTTILQQNSTTTDGSHIIRAEWKIGNETFDGLTHEHIFTTCGEQTVQLQVTSSSGCNASIQKMLYINPVAQVSFSPLTACQHVAVTFQPTVSIESGSIDRYEWKIADETIVAQTIKKIFSTAGEFPVSLEVTSDKGCKNSAQNSILVRNAPQLYITYSAQCEQNPVYFFDRTIYTAINSAISRTWFVNNEIVSNNEVFSETLNETSDVKYTVHTMNGCELSWEKPIVLHPLPQAIVDSVFSCENTEITMTDKSDGNGDEIIEQQWRIDNTVYNEKNPTVTFPNTGTYNVTLLVKTQNGCTDSVQSVIMIERTPKASFTTIPQEGIASLPIQYNNTSNYAKYYTWIFAHSDTIQTENTAPLYHTFYDTVDTHTQLRAYSSNGCVDSAEYIIPMQKANHQLKIVDCTLNENHYGFETHVQIVNSGNVPVHYINFIIKQNTVAPYAETWNGQLVPGDTLMYMLTHVSQNPISYISLQAQILSNPQSPPLFSTNFSKDFTNIFTVYSFGPVPADETLHIRFSSIDANPVTITLYDMYGQISSRWNFSDLEYGYHEYELNVATLAPGRYNCHVTQGKNIIKKSLIIR